MIHFTDTDDLDLLALTFEGDVSEVEGFDVSDDEDEIEAFHANTESPKCVKPQKDTPVKSGTKVRRNQNKTSAKQAASKQQGKKKGVSTRSKSKKKGTPPKWHEDESVCFECIEPVVKSSKPPTKPMTPYQYFGLFIDSEIISDICEQTNLYSSQQDETPIDVTSGDIEQHIGQLLLMGVTKVPSYRLHWGSTTRYAPIADVMPRNKFEAIKRCLHFNDNTKIKQRDGEGYDKLLE